MNYVRTVSIGDDIIDPRDIVERVKELESEIEDARTDEENPYNAEEIEEVYADEINELAKWNAVLAEISDPEDGEALILDSYFTEYAQQLAEDIGAIPSDLSWPLYSIDWEAAARDLQMDYTSVEIDGYTYWTRG